MPGVWLGENEIPAVEETSNGVFEFALYRETKLKPRIVAFSLFFGFASLFCIPALIFSFNDGWQFFFSLGFYLLVGLLLGWTLFGHSEYKIDTIENRIARSQFVFGRRVSLRSRSLDLDDKFVVYLMQDNDNTGANHAVYANISGIDRYFVSIHLPTASRSEELIKWLDKFSKLLEIDHSEYKTIWHYFSRLLTFRVRNL